MWLPLLALIIGFGAIYLVRVQIPSDYSEYIGIAVVAGLDSVMGAIRSYLEGKFNDRVLVTGFFTNAAVAVLLLYLGNRLNIRYFGTAIMVALVIRIFTNLGFVRRYVVARIFERQLADKSFPEP
jgi:small basic protein